MAPATVHCFHACKQYIFFVSHDGNFIGGIVALHDPTCHTQTVIFWGARWYKTAGFKSSVVTPILPSSPLPLIPKILFRLAHICCSSSPPSSSTVLSLGCKAMVRSYCSSSRAESGSARRHPPIPYRSKPYDYSPDKICDCGVKMLRWIAWTDENTGRRFYNCGIRAVLL
jgi:hypothetical protein